MRPVIPLLIALLFLTACSSMQRPAVTPSEEPDTRYSLSYDKLPENVPDVSQVPDATPRFEPLSRAGNRSPYEVMGKTYRVLPSANGYNEIGIASWYGKKFHGYLTSNGEVYDMYTMSAAHKSLPLPSFARVTNLENGASVVVRVNDRGPFHPDRIIDLSYAAAYRLNMIDEGTARVRVETITVAPQGEEDQMIDSQFPEPMAQRASFDRQYIQVGAFSSQQTAKDVQLKLIALVEGESIGIYPTQGSNGLIYRVKIGPMQPGQFLQHLFQKLKDQGFNQAFMTQSTL